MGKHPNSCPQEVENSLPRSIKCLVRTPDQNRIRVNWERLPDFFSSSMSSTRTGLLTQTAKRAAQDFPLTVRNAMLNAGNRQSTSHWRPYERLLANPCRASKRIAQTAHHRAAFSAITSPIISFGEIVSIQSGGLEKNFLRILF